MDPIIEVHGLSKRYRLGALGAGSLREATARAWARLRGAPMATDGREFWALRDLSFSLQAGEVLGILGRNGAGKSTLLKVLSRITTPTQGEAILRGRVASLLEVGTGFHPELSGRENIYLNGAILGMTRAEVRRHFDAIVAFAEIGEFIDTPVKRYSSGMYVRLAFAIAAHLDSEILIVDEVLAVGDQAFQDKCLGRMDAVRRSGRTVLFVSHNLGLIRKLCTRCLLLDHGRLLAEGPTDAVARQYAGGAGKASRVYKPRQGEARVEPHFTGISIEQPGAADASLALSSSLPIAVRCELAGLLAPDLIVSVEIRSPGGVLSVHTSEDLQSLTPDSGPVRICQIPPNLLNRGTHLVDVYLYSRQRAVREAVEGCLEFVLELDRSEVDPSGWKGVCSPHAVRWEYPHE